MPQDQREMERLDFQHHLLRQVVGRNYLAPVVQPQSILDVGCGTGRWALELAREFRAAAVIGLDLLPPPPYGPYGLYGDAPENCFFRYGNVLEALPFPDATFEFVHQRCFADAIPHAAWPHVAQELVRITQPGGLIELVEFGMPPTVGPALRTLNQWMSELAAQRGLDLLLGSRVGVFLSDAGAEGVVAREFPIPLGRHGGRIGLLAQANQLATLRTLRASVIGKGIASEQMFDATLEQAQREMVEGQYFWRVYFHYAQRWL
jgi:SAM-dependent methyltransferase